MLQAWIIMSDAVKEPPKDVVLVYSRTDDGQGARVIRSREGQLEAGEMRALREGAPIQGAEVVKLHAREESPLLFDVEVQHDARTTRAHAGPARVATRAYRANFDDVFKPRAKSKDDDPLLN